MNWSKIKPYVIFLLIVFAVSALCSVVTAYGMPHYDELQKPALTPHRNVFAVVWNIIYVLMGIGAALVWKSSSPDRQHAMLLFGLQLAINLLWTIFFFGMKAPFFALCWLIALWIIVLNMIWSYYPISRAAALMQLPYLFWLTFAGYLNLGIWVLNR
jgi:tryptophan-rich sensory protein